MVAADVTAMSAEGTFRAEVPRSESYKLVVLEVSNPSEHPVYLSVISASEDRAITPIYPPEGVRDNVLDPGETRPIYITVEVPKLFRRLDRAMLDRYLLIGTPVWADFHSLQRKATVRGGPAPTSVPPIIETAMTGGLTRGASIRADDPTRFGIAAVDLYVADATDQ